jgi:hypothetical protein
VHAFCCLVDFPCDARVIRDSRMRPAMQVGEYRRVVDAGLMAVGWAGGVR